jgi:RimJ/RimL family protein N-acetyltransferase
MELKTKRLKLRPINQSDAAMIFSYRSDSITNKYQGWIPKTTEDVNRFIEKVSSEINIENTWFQFVIIERSSSDIIGDLGIHFMENEQAEIGCTLAKEHQGKGYATEALQSVIDLLFGELNKHRVIASVDPQNRSSIALLGRLKFRKEAHIKESLLIDGEWVDDLIYALLKKEWSSIVVGDSSSI